MIKKLILNNFQSHTNSELEFSDGINAVVGESDSGKSSIIRIIEWIRTNKPKGINFIKEGSNNVLGQLETENAIIIRERTSKNTGSYKINNEEYSVMGNDVPEEITTLLNLSDINIQTQLNNHFLILNPSGQIAQYLNNITKLDKLTIGVDKLRGIKGKKDEELNLYEKDKSDIETFLKSGIVETIESLSKNYKTVSKLIQQETALSQDIEKIRRIIYNIRETEKQKIPEDKLIKLRKKLKESNELFIRLADINNKIKNVENIIFNMTSTIQQLEQYNIDIESIRKELQSVKKQLTNCPYCSSVLTDKTKKILLRDI